MSKEDNRVQDVIIVVLIMLVIVFAWFFISEQKKNELKDKAIRRLTDENDELKSAYLDLLQEYLLLSENTPQEIIADIERLKHEAVKLSKDVHIELGSVIDNVRDKKGVKAVRELGKIIENVLKEKALADANFKKKPTLGNLLEHAKNCMWINPNEHAYAELIKEIRNKESHELNVQVESHKVGLAIYVGIDILFTLHKKL
jgi:hypothetical protein